MDEFKKYLSEQVLVEGNPVTYKWLSRALNVHVNTAKEMLFDFYNSQNAQCAGTVHATYLILGITKSSQQNSQGGDIDMPDSLEDGGPFSEEATISTVSLVREEGLNDLLELYEQVLSIHIYSISAHSPKDLQLLSDSSTKLTESGQDWDNPTAYGAINNPEVRMCRLLERPLEMTASKPEPPQRSSVRPENPSQTKKPSKAESQLPSASFEKQHSSAPLPKSAARLKGGIMQSFAKAATKQKSESSQSQKEAIDQAVAAALSDDGEDDFVLGPDHKPAARDPKWKSRKQREEELQRMMDDDDEEDEPESRAESPEPSDEPINIPVEAPAAEPAEVETRVTDGRRKGRRRVMKKKQIMDEEGYLVTIQEATWESFSEDEASQPPRVTEKPQPTTPPAASSEASKPTKKASGKPGQGSITSFFSKK